MQFQASKNLKLLLIFILPLHFQSSVTAEDPTFTVCGSSNYTSGSQYETNLSAILPTLSSNGVIRSDSFYNSTYGDDPNTVYGYSQCMSAASEDVCRQCLINSTAEIIRRCPNKTEATIRYCNCILRYSDKRFFSELDTTIRFLAYPLAKVSNTSVFNAQLGGLMDGLSSAAASATSKYAQNMTRYNDFINIHGLAQCTRDLLGGDCYNCLRNMINDIPNCCDERSGGNVYSVSCNIRYETYPFLDPLPPPPAVAASPTPTGESPEMKPTQRKGNRDTSKTIVIIIPIVVLLVALSTMCAWLLIRRKKKKNQRNSETGYEEETEITMAESFSFNLSTLIAATNNFSTDNKLGQGGFGPVYKGKLSDGREIAVKRLSKRSGQGLEELLNEVALVAKLQHRNLVRLWGWCIEEQEKMLVYEYEANTSLDKFLFGWCFFPSIFSLANVIFCLSIAFNLIQARKLLKIQSNVFNWIWERRYKIIVGIARGLLYLHEESRLRIIHRDLKASNILLDGNMNSKIADFRMARLFSVDQTQDNTIRIAGTYGYMAPEYIMHGQFSIQSDVFSFGVLVLEIVTGRENLPFSEDGHTTNLLSYEWKHWNQGTSLEIIDQSIVDHHSTNEMLRCLHMGLLCVQDDATERPTMSSVVLMLNSYSMTFPVPSPPAFFVGSNSMN